VETLSDKIMLNQDIEWRQRFRLKPSRSKCRQVWQTRSGRPHNGLPQAFRSSRAPAPSSIASTDLPEARTTDEIDSADAQNPAHRRSAAAIYAERRHSVLCAAGLDGGKDGVVKTILSAMNR